MQKLTDGLSKSVDAMPYSAGNSLWIALFGDAINSAVGLVHKINSIPKTDKQHQHGIQNEQYRY